MLLNEEYKTIMQLGRLRLKWIFAWNSTLRSFSAKTDIDFIKTKHFGSQERFLYLLLSHIFSLET